jgi:hypothetical protein
MAQPPEAAPLRLQSSLDSAPVQPRVHQPNLDALAVEQKQHPHHPQHHHQQQQPRDQPEQQQQQQQQARIPDNAQPPGPPQTNNAPSVGRGTHSTTEPRGGHSPGIGDAKTRAEAALPVDARSDNHASAAAPAAHDTQSGTQHNSGASAPGPPDMSNTQPVPGPARQPVTYASPASYPPPGMPPVSPYLYSTQPIPSDPYRPNPTTLPSMRTLDHRQPQAQPQHGIPMSTHLAGPVTPAPAPAHMAYYGVHPHSHMYGLPDPNAMRFALAPGLGHDPRIALSGGRHKKVPNTQMPHSP